jgi:signal transduction histidine kinase
VLDPFVQGDNSLARRYAGTGLGLPLVRAFVELHGGTVKLDSEVDVGTVARLTFPAERIVAWPEPRRTGTGA